MSIEGTRGVAALGFIIRAEREDLTGIRGAQEDFAASAARDSGDLRGCGLGQLGENTSPIDGYKGALVARAGEESSIGRQSQSVNDVIARVPEFFMGPIARDAVNAAGNSRRKGKEGSLTLRQGGNRGSWARDCY